MSVNGIGATGCPAAGYETKKADRYVGNFADQMCGMVQTTQMRSGTFELHISNDEDGKAIGSVRGADNKTHDDLFGMTDWISVLKDAMQTQYDAGNLKGYLGYKQFWDFLDK